jgi:hypothetical protein
VSAAAVFVACLPPTSPQDARKGVLFDDFPPVLQLQLKRFEYDMQRDTMVKVGRGVMVCVLLCVLGVLDGRPVVVVVCSAQDAQQATGAVDALVLRLSLTHCPTTSFNHSFHRSMTAMSFMTSWIWTGRTASTCLQT